MGLLADAKGIDFQDLKKLLSDDGFRKYSLIVIYEVFVGIYGALGKIPASEALYHLGGSAAVYGAYNLYSRKKTNEVIEKLTKEEK